MSTATYPSAVSLPTMPVVHFTVAKYHQMIEAGIFGENDNVELLKGLIVPKMPRKPPHDGVLWIIDHAIQGFLPQNWHTRGQSAITLEDSEPEPDISVVRGPMTIYLTRHPQRGDIGIVVEISDTTLDFDRNEKGPIYAAALIPHYWIVNIAGQLIEVYTNPANGAYQSHSDYRKGQKVPLLLDGQELGQIAVADIFAGL
jgi:Uma2 family endonuclease